MIKTKILVISIVTLFLSLFCFGDTILAIVWWIIIPYMILEVSLLIIAYKLFTKIDNYEKAKFEKDLYNIQ